jgi:hypothetical protein
MILLKAVIGLAVVAGLVWLRIKSYQWREEQTKRKRFTLRLCFLARVTAT